MNLFNSLKTFISLQVIILGLSGPLFAQELPDKPSDRAQALRAFEYINLIRSNPAVYSKIVGTSLNKVKPQKALTWNDTLAKVALARANDMARRRYFGHVNPDGYAINFYMNEAGYTLMPEWLEKKNNNFFESIQAGADSAIQAVNYLLVDEGVSDLGHRKHLLGMDEWNASLKDIGIAFINTPNAPYKSYMVIVIGMHYMAPKIIHIRRR